MNILRGIQLLSLS